MDVVIALVCSLAGACTITWLIFRLAMVVEAWPGRKFALLIGAGIVLMIALFGAVGKVPKKKEIYTTPCNTTRASPCHNGVYTDTLESNGGAGEAAKLGLITTGMGTMFGLFMLGSLWSKASGTRR